MSAQILVAWSRLLRRWRSLRGRSRLDEAHAPEGSPAASPSQRLAAAGWIRLAEESEVGRAVAVRRFVHEGRVRTVLLWRTRTHQPVAMDSRCPHKPFSMVGGRLVGDALECPIHRRLFGPDGLCLNRPNGKRAELLEVREVEGYLWISQVRSPGEPTSRSPEVGSA